MRYFSVITVLWLGVALFSPAWGQSAPVKVTDQAGRSVRLPEEIRRIVALAPSITEIIFALEQDHRLKGVTQYSDFPAEARALPRVGSYIQPELERIIALKPDICFAIKDGNPKTLVSRLEDLDIPVYAVDPRDLETVMRTVLEIGKILKADKQAEALVADMRSRIEAVWQTVSKAAYRPKVFFQIGISPIVSIGSDTFIHELIVRAGGENVGAGPKPYPRFNTEQVLALSPDILIITSMARAKGFEQVRENWCRWPNLPAARSGRVHIVDSDIFDRPTPRLVDALEVLAKLLHPGLYDDG